MSCVFIPFSLPATRNPQPFDLLCSKRKLLYVQVRKVASEKGTKITGTVAMLTNARLKGIIPNLKNLLGNLIDQGFHLDPQGLVYKDALKNVDEL